MKSPRSGKSLSPHELVRFIDLLAQTGNFALACERLGRAKSGLYKRRLRDPLFDSECIAALAMARMDLPSGERQARIRSVESCNCSGLSNGPRTSFPWGLDHPQGYEEPPPSSAPPAPGILFTCSEKPAKVQLQ